MNIGAVIEELEKHIEDPHKGLPEEVFLLISRLTPLVNVDLLIKNEENQTLLTWRDDGVFPAGWHIPGGIVRYKETLADRVNAVAAKELGSTVKFNEEPIQIKEIIIPSLVNRGHAFSYLYKCWLTSLPDQKLKFNKGVPKNGEWAWHGKCPDDLMSVQGMYRQYFGPELV